MTDPRATAKGQKASGRGQRAKKHGLTRLAVALVAGLAAFSAYPNAQGRGGQPAAAAQPPSPRDSAPIDLTGYWVSIVTEDWRWRMVTPPKGDYASVPLNAEARKVADAWDTS